jgi:non-specific serine/threonine protein kinase
MVEQLGQYKILEPIGAGGMGDVYRARDTRLGRTVAIKVLSAAVAGDPARRERFMREARAAAALSHPNIAALYEVGEDAGELFLAFEFVAGETLRAVIGGRPLNPRRAIDLGVQLADALADAHAEGIVHRDIKPDNIIVTPKEKAKILDFGLATWTAGGAERAHAADAATMMTTGAGTTLGTVAYMSPEQALGEPVDQRTDIFSLGIVLFEMLTGRLPFSGATATALSLEIVQAPAPAPSSVNRSVPSELDPIVLKALAKNLADRYESAATLAAELRSVGAVLDVRSGTSEPADLNLGLPRTSRSGGRRSESRRYRPNVWRPALAGLLLLALAAGTMWMERGRFRTLWRRTLGPAPAPVIAVIPLELAGADRSQTYFADGLTDDLISRLGQTPGLKVLGRSATRDYRGRSPRDVARELNAAVVLTGSMRPMGDTMKISLELIDPADGTDIWTGQYTRDVKDVFAVQAEVAEQVASALRVTLKPTPASARAASRTVDPRAYELYVRGRQATAQRRTSDAIRYYEQALAADAGLAEALAGIVEALEYATITAGAPIDAPTRQRMQTTAARAYQLDPDLPQANLAMALAAPPLSETLGYLRHALELDPTYAEALHQVGDQILDFDPPRAIDFYRASLAADPSLEAGHTDIASALITLNRWDEAHREVDAVRVEPWPGWRDAFHALIDIDQGRNDAALQRLERTALSAETRGAIRAKVLATAGRPRDALAELAAAHLPAEICSPRALMAALRRDTGDAAGARQLANAALARTREESVDADDMRCGAYFAAAIGDAAALGDLLQRIAAREDWLRYWALQITVDRGSLMLRGRYYPWNRIVDAPPVAAAREKLEAAYVREREIAKTALSGLP